MSRSDSFLNARISARVIIALCACFLFISCGSDEDSTSPSNNGMLDSGSPTDAARSDASNSGSDLGADDTGTASDLPNGVDLGSEDMGTDAQDDMSADGGMNVFPTLADYLPCVDDVDCPVGLGECVKTVSLNRPDADGTTTVSIQTFFPTVAAGEGVCSRDCGLDVTACDALSLRDSDGGSVSFTCQVVTVGESAYPDPAPAFPFDGQIDLTAMAVGPAFGAVCRPPFGLNEAHIDDFCGECDVTQGCGDPGVCWRFETELPVIAGESGVCLEPVPTMGCPAGFESRTLSDGTNTLGDFCVPLTETCGACQDRDDDGRGAGHCAEPETDCDDFNAVAYYDPADMEHPFPANCGGFDYNCNGLSDDDEQVGNNDYAADHCEFCYDAADGDVVQMGTAAEATLKCKDGIIRAACTDETAAASCDMDPRGTGCESTAMAGGTIYYLDDDGDTFGDSNFPKAGCPGMGPPAAHVGNDLDCNDSDAAINPDARDLCECWGDCATAGARVDNNCNDQFDEDVTRYAWYPDLDADGSPDLSATPSEVYCGAPSPMMVIGTPGATPADCADGDPTRWGPGRILVLTAAGGAELSRPFTEGVDPPRNGDGELYLAIDASAATEICDEKDNNCDGVEDEGVKTTYYDDSGDGDGFGDPATAIEACSPPAGYVEAGGDCEPTGAMIHPCDAQGNNCPVEICDLYDNDCNGFRDEDDSNLQGRGGACTASATGACAMGTQETCELGSWTCKPGEPLSFDDPLTAAADDDCDGAETIYYVAAARGSDTQSGTATNPLQTVRAALLKVPAATEIRVSGDASTDAEIVLSSISPVAIIGGWTDGGATGAAWTHAGSSSTLTRANATGLGANESIVVVRTQNTPMGTTLAYLDLETGVQTANGKHDVIGVHANGGNLVLHAVSITAGNGAPGASDTTAAEVGEPGEDGVANAKGLGCRVLAGGPLGWGSACTVDSDCAGICYRGSCREWHNGGGDGDYMPWSYGGNDGAGFAAGAGGTYPAGVGGDGGKAIYTAALPRSEYNLAYFDSMQLEHTLSVEPYINRPDALDGSGGGGGSALSSLDNWFGGGGGGGGCQGEFGEHGGSGSSAFALLAFSANIQRTANSTMSLQSGDGGVGGIGQQGGDGGDGGEGGYSPLGSKGGDGSGGAGAPGGNGGNGGWSMAVFSQGTPDLCPRFNDAIASVGEAGRGGAGGAGGVGGTHSCDTNSALCNPDKSDDGPSGVVGNNGSKRECFHSTSCSTSSDCPSTNSADECRAGWCYPPAEP